MRLWFRFRKDRTFTFKVRGPVNGSVVFVTLDFPSTARAEVEARKACAFHGEGASLDVAFMDEPWERHYPVGNRVAWYHPLDKPDPYAARAAILAACTPKGARR